MSHFCDQETGGDTPQGRVRPYTLARHTALRAIGATILREGGDTWTAADELGERLPVEWAYQQFRRCMGLGFADQTSEDQAMFLFYLADASQAGDLA